MAEFSSPFPASPRIAYERNPIRLVAVEVRFDIHFGLRGKSPEAFRDEIANRYPRYIEAALGVQLPPAEAGGNGYEDIRALHMFRSEDGRQAVRLSELFLSYQTSDYVSYEQFRRKWEEVFATFLDLYPTQAIRRANLKYLDVFKRSELELDETPWSELLRPEVCGLLSSSISDVVNHFVTVSNLDLNHDNYSATIKTGPVHDGGEQCFHVEADFTREGPFGPAEVLPTCDELKRHAGRFFRWVVTEQLGQAMGPRPVPDFTEPNP